MAQPSISDEIDNQLVVAALRKRNASQRVTGQEREALKRWEKKRDEDQRWENYRKCPQKDFLVMSGRQAKQVREQAARYGMPFDGRTINLPAFVKWVYDFLSKYARIIALADAEDLGSQTGSPWQEKLREETYYIRRLDRQKREGELVDRHVMHDGLARMAVVFRKIGERLERRFGPEAFAIYEEGLKVMEHEVNQLFADETVTETPEAKPAKTPRRKRRA